MNTGLFTLVKWYMDCVTDAGEAVILYCADLRWRALHASMGSVLESRAGETPRTRTSLGSYHVHQQSAEITAEYPRLDVAGTWRALCPGVQRTVYEQAGGTIVWNCVQPGSRVEVRIAGRELEGLGYVECLTLTLPSWTLPIRALRWGRFVSPHRALAWVDWQGPYSTRFAVRDGHACDLNSVSDREVVIEDASLQIDPGDSLRSGPLNTTILSGAPALRRLFPASLFNIREQKWKSRGTLMQTGSTSPGWVIHELVEWDA